MAAASMPPLPRYGGNDPAVQAWANQLCRALEAWSAGNVAPTGGTWTVNGTTPSRIIDPTTVTSLAQLVNIVGTLAQDLSGGGPPLVT